MGMLCRQSVYEVPCKAAPGALLKHLLTLYILPRVPESLPVDCLRLQMWATCYAEWV